MRIVFAGTPEAAVEPLRAVAALANGSAQVDGSVLAITREDAPVGRRRVLTPSPVAQIATELGLPVVKTNRFTQEVTARLVGLAPDLGIVVAFGAIIPDEVLSIPRLGWVNLHFSMLPKWRGAAPAQRSIAAGDPPSISLVRVVAELDAGPVYRQRVIDLGPDITGSAALTALAQAGAADLATLVAQLADGTAPTPTPQVGEPSYAHKLSREDGRIDWTKPVTKVYDLVRAMTTEPGAWTMDGAEPIKILAAGPASRIARLDEDKDGQPGRVVVESGAVFVQCRDGFLPVNTVQPAGKKSMTASAWLLGKRGRVVLG